MSFPFSHIQYILIDLDGVMYLGDTPLSGGAGFISWLRRRSISFRLVTNNSTMTPEQYVVKLSRMGIKVSTDEIFTSALATAAYLGRQRQSGTSAYVIGGDGLREALNQAKIAMRANRPDWVIVGLDRELTYEKLALGALAIESGARFLGTNPDTSFPSERGLLPGAGAILAALEAATGKAPVVIGKPQPAMMGLALASLGSEARNTAMLGDRLDTDIEGANALGLPSILVLTGVSTRREAEEGPIHPSLTVADLSTLERKWEAAIRRSTGD